MYLAIWPGWLNVAFSCNGHSILWLYLVFSHFLPKHMIDCQDHSCWALHHRLLLFLISLSPRLLSFHYFMTKFDSECHNYYNIPWAVCLLGEWLWQVWQRLISVLLWVCTQNWYHSLVHQLLKKTWYVSVMHDSNFGIKIDSAMIPRLPWTGIWIKIK